MWKGGISFGLVCVPVKLYKATDEASAGVGLCNTHRECGTAVKEPKYCPKCEKMLESGDLQKAYPLDKKKEQCIPITEEELAALPLASAHVIQVDGFIDKIPDIRYYDQVYVIEPEDAGIRAFALFEQALKDTGKMGIAKIGLGSKEHLCGIIPTGDGLMYVVALHWASELRSTSELKRPGAKISEKELAMAKMLIGTLPSNIDLTQYTNEYGAALKKLIEDKRAGIVITAPVAAPVKEVDLIEQLMASLKAAQPVGV
jgi:DNA end-binding protein Ku